jgi:uncharacterized protein
MFAPQYPDVNFIIPHLGSFTDDWKAHQQVIYQIARYPNVFADTSAVRQFDYLVQAVRRAGPRKLLFGSDGPWTHPGLELHKIKLLGLPLDQQAAVLGGNAMRLLRRVPARHHVEFVSTRHSHHAPDSNSAPIQRDQLVPESEYHL